MKKAIIFLALNLGLLSLAQETPSNKKTEKKFLKKSKDKKELFLNPKLTPEQKHQYFKQALIEKILTTLEIQKEKEEKARILVQEYLNQRDSIIKQFNPNEITDQLSNEEIKAKIQKGFEVAQKLLDTRKAYTDKFLKEFTPQQVVKIYKIEKEMIQHFRKNKDKK